MASTQIATISLRNHTRDLSVKYALYEYLEYFKDDPEMLALVAEGNDVPFSMFQPTESSLEFSTPYLVKINNILAALGDSIEHPKGKKNFYKSNPFKMLSEESPQLVSQSSKLHPSLAIYSSVCTAMDIANADKTKADRASLGLVVSAVTKDGVLLPESAKFINLNRYIYTPLSGQNNSSITEYGFAITIGKSKIYDQDGPIDDTIICGADRVNCELNLNDAILRKIGDDDHFEEQNSILQRKLIMLPALKLLKQHKTGELLHGKDLENIEELPKTPEELEALAKEVFTHAFLSITTPTFDKTSGILELVRYIESKL